MTRAERQARYDAARAALQTANANARAARAAYLAADPHAFDHQRGRAALTAKQRPPASLGSPEGRDFTAAVAAMTAALPAYDAALGDLTDDLDAEGAALRAGRDPSP